MNEALGVSQGEMGRQRSIVGREAGVSKVILYEGGGVVNAIFWGEGEGGGSQGDILRGGACQRNIAGSDGGRHFREIGLRYTSITETFFFQTRLFSCFPKL